MASDVFDCGTNYLQPTGFKVLIDRVNFPSLQFYAQTVAHPDANLDPAEVNFRRVAPIPFTGDTLQFGVLSMDILLDEDMNSYRELYSWMESTVEQKHVTASSKLIAQQTNMQPSYYDISVSVLSSHNNVNREFKYINAFPISMGNINFEATTDQQYIIFPVSFRFDYFTFT